MGTKVQCLLEQLNVKTLKDADLMQKFIIPQFASLGRMDQNKFMHQMCERWPELRKQQPLVDALKNLAFVPVLRTAGAASDDVSQAGVAKPSDLLDPRVPLLAEFFEGSPHMFPRGEYATSGWLRVLADLGLREKLDKDLLPRAAAQLATESLKLNSPGGNNKIFDRKRLSSRASRLILHFRDYFCSKLEANPKGAQMEPAPKGPKYTRFYPLGPIGTLWAPEDP